MDFQKLIVNGEVWVKEAQLKDTEIKICILQRGWVMIGRYERIGNDCTLRNASVIRIWGTTKGLGEIALNGPTSTTKLDACGTAKFDYLTTIAVLDCNEEKWRERL